MKRLQCWASLTSHDTLTTYWHFMLSIIISLQCKNNHWHLLLDLPWGLRWPVTDFWSSVWFCSVFCIAWPRNGLAKEFLWEFILKARWFSPFLGILSCTVLYSMVLSFCIVSWLSSVFLLANTKVVRFMKANDYEWFKKYSVHAFFNVYGIPLDEWKRVKTCAHSNDIRMFGVYWNERK